MRSREFIDTDMVKKYGITKVTLAKNPSLASGLLSQPMKKEEALEINQRHEQLRIEAFKATLKAQPFIFSKWSKTPDTNGLEASEIASLPFESIWIEVKNGYLDDDSVEGALISEKSPGEISCFSLLKNKDKYSVTHLDLSHSRKDELVTIRNIEANLWQLTRSGFAGKVSVKERIKIGKINSEENEVKKISSVIYIRDRYETEIPTMFDGRDIDYTYRFMVRGHWRKFEGVGKNREGHRGVDGFTWVSEHQRGPEEAPLIPKVRVVQ